MLKSLNIKNYRCINDFKLDKIKPITLFVGRNNTGKSSLLESISLLCSAKDGFFDSLGMSLFDKIVLKRGGMRYLDTMIKINSDESRISGNIDNTDVMLNIYSNNYIITNGYEHYVDDVVNQYFDSMLSRMGTDELRRRGIEYDFEVMSDRITRTRMMLENLKNEVKNHVKFYVEYIDTKNDKYEFIIKLSDIVYRRLRSMYEEFSYILPRIPIQDVIRSKNTGRSNVVFMVEPTFEYLKELQRRVARSGDLIRVLRQLRLTVPNFEDIREVEDNFVIYMRDSEVPLPLQAMGDGFQAKIAMLSGLSTIKEGYAIMEEPESKLHPGYMISIADQIVNNTKNIQYFISTHNVELIEMIFDKNIEIAQVVRLYKIKDMNEIDYEILNGEEVLEEIDTLKLDLRGI